MAVSLTAEYLYQGSKFLSSDPVTAATSVLRGEEPPLECPELFLGIGRGIYGLGTVIIAPTGLAYHICMAAYRGIESLCQEDDKAAETLRNHSWQHLSAAGMDALACGMVLLGLIVILAVAEFFFSGEPIFVAPMFLFFAELYLVDNEKPHEWALPFNYMLSAAAWVKLLSDVKINGVSDQERYSAEFAYSKAVSKGWAIDTPLSEKEIQDYNEEVQRIARSYEAEDLFSKAIELSLFYPTLLSRYNKLTPEYQQRFTAFAAKKDEIMQLKAAVIALTLSSTEQNRNGLSKEEYLIREFTRRYKSIHDALPPVGAPAPALPAAAAAAAAAAPGGPA
ncbi:MAG: hypothetical protein HYX48_07780 [Chlamydiales bacterium]|nr:hypothetical protein [Chlamydiales bacterium]